MTKRHLIKVAKLEIKAWHALPNGLVLTILFSFIHRATTGESIEEMMAKFDEPMTDYEI